MGNGQEEASAADAVWYSLPLEVKQRLIGMLDPKSRHDVARVDHDTREAEQSLRLHENRVWIRRHAAQRDAWVSELATANSQLRQRVQTTMPEEPLELRTLVVDDCSFAVEAFRARSVLLPWLEVGDGSELQSLRSHVEQATALILEVVRRLQNAIGHLVAHLRLDIVPEETNEYFAEGRRLHPWYVAATFVWRAVADCLDVVDPHHGLEGLRDQLADLHLAQDWFSGQFPAFVGE